MSAETTSSAKEAIGQDGLHTDHTRRWLIGLLIALVVIYLVPDIFYSVDSGQAAVVWSRFGGGTEERVRSEGFHAKWIWDRVFLYNVRLQEHSETFDVLSSDGLRMEVDLSVRFQLIEEHIGLLHRNVGPNYRRTLLMPVVGALAREEISAYEPSELYSGKRGAIERAILRRLKEASPAHYHIQGDPERALHIENVFIRSIRLPEVVSRAIDQKLAQRHLMLEYDYRIEKEQKETERKRIEAEGIRLFQDIVSEGISERYLKWKGIEATLELAQSENSKIVIIGGGEDGLPIILGGLDAETGVATRKNSGNQ